MTPLKRVRDALERAGCNPRGNGDKLTARCPAHDDRRASLALSEGDDRRALIHCHAGCPVEQIVAALGLTPADLFARRNGDGTTQKRHEVCAYAYTDETGKVLYEVVRFAPKDFRQRRPDGNGAWTWKLGRTRRVLYKLPEVIATVADGGTVFIVEGERDADSINSLPDAGNVIATCNPGGAGKWRTEFSEVLRDAPVIVVADKDEPGYKHAWQVADALGGIAASVRVVEGREGKDAADHLAAGHGLADFVPVERAAEPEAAEAPGELVPFAAKSEKTIKRAPYLRADVGNAELFARMHAERLRFDHKRAEWLHWAGHWWARDADGLLWRLAKRTARELFKIAADLEDGHERAAEAKWGLKSMNRDRLSSMLRLAENEEPLADSGERWDRDPYLLGVSGGIVDLKTGKLRAGRRDDWITLAIPIAFDPAARAPRWERFLEEVFADKDGTPNVEMIDFISCAVGYSMTGCTNEQCFFICHGPGANGKSVLLRVLRETLGPYAWNTSFTTLEHNARGSIPQDLAHLAGKRVVTASETGAAARLNEERLKMLTGCDAVNARYLFGREFNFVPNAKFWLAVNHLPRVADTSKGFWRRVRLIPFHRSFDPSAEPDLEAKLRAELQGILAWAVRGALEWQEKGLRLPEAVTAATADYAAKSDPLAEFLAECCSIELNASERAGRLGRAYIAWARNQGLRDNERLGGRTFGEEVTGRFDKIKLSDGLWYVGVQLSAVGAALADSNPATRGGA